MLRVDYIELLKQKNDDLIANPNIQTKFYAAGVINLVIGSSRNVDTKRGCICGAICKTSNKFTTSLTLIKPVYLKHTRNIDDVCMMGIRYVVDSFLSAAHNLKTFDRVNIITTSLVSRNKLRKVLDNMSYWENCLSPIEKAINLDDPQLELLCNAIKQSNYVFDVYFINKNPSDNLKTSTTFIEINNEVLNFYDYREIGPLVSYLNNRAQYANRSNYKDIPTIKL